MNRDTHAENHVKMCIMDSLESDGMSLDWTMHRILFLLNDHIHSVQHNLNVYSYILLNVYVYVCRVEI